MKELHRFRQFLTEGVIEDEIASRIRKLGKENGIANADIEKYVGELSGFFEPDAYKNTTDAELLDDLKLYMDLAEGKLLKEEKYSGAIIRKGTSDKAKEDTKIVRQALKDKGIKFTNRGEFGMDFKNADLAQIKKVIAGAKVGEFIVSHDVDESN